MVGNFPYCLWGKTACYLQFTFFLPCKIKYNDQGARWRVLLTLCKGKIKMPQGITDPLLGFHFLVFFCWLSGQCHLGDFPRFCAFVCFGLINKYRKTKCEQKKQIKIFTTITAKECINWLICFNGSRPALLVLVVCESFQTCRCPVDPIDNTAISFFTCTWKLEAKKQGLCQEVSNIW